VGKKRCITGIGPDLVTPGLRALFDPAEARLMPCFAVLDGSLPGKIFTDRLDHPTWGAV
jgi:hypothetical protein